MHRIDTKTAQKDKFGAGKNGFTRGNPQTGTPATDLDDDYFDMLQEELCSVVEASGASLEKGRHDQLLTALRALLLSRKNPFGDIKSDGTVKTALENLGLRETISRAADALQKSQNGGDIPDKDLFVRRIGAARAFDGAVIIGCDDNPWTTAEFIVWLESQGAFNHPYWMCRGSWSYAYNKIITDTGCGNICLAGAVIEVMGVRGAMTIRVTTSHSVSGW
ncbi:hypothetical protein GUN90_004103 [Salmonella enterica]|nr:hypothetical protein [Salmonella enterica subsp. enterica serovar 4,[5],12:i:-]EDQ2918096.1 hypothetical protein [Salmonella enterica subsp. enterica serovar 4,[5],12:i:-]EDT0604434.1 hypothetical protein [Salmonella enterica]